MGKAWSTRNADNLTRDPTETNPEQDIADTREHFCQIRPEGELAHSYHRNGKHIGTLTKEKLNRLHERYTQAVGAPSNQTLHQSTLRTELWEDHKIRVSTFEEEIGHLLIRYSSKEEKEERKKNLQKDWTFPAQMQRALQQAFGINTELFASPLNVHHNTTMYFAKYDRDKVFGARGSAWATNWMKLGAYQFNPAYTPQDLKKALDFAIAATTTHEPVFGETDDVRIARERYESAKDVVAAIYSKGRHRKWAKAIRQHQVGGDYFNDGTDVSKLAKVIVAIESEISTAGLDCDIFDLDHPTHGVQRVVNELLYDTLTYI
eukprot:gene27872-biopygen28912